MYSVTQIAVVSFAGAWLYFCFLVTDSYEYIDIRGEKSKWTISLT